MAESASVNQYYNDYLENSNCTFGIQYETIVIGDLITGGDLMSSRNRVSIRTQTTFASC